MKPRFFWVYANGKTIKEISWEEWAKMVNRDFNRETSRLLVRIHDNDIYFRKGSQGIWMRKKNLKEILQKEKNKQ